MEALSLLEPVASWLWRASWQASVLVLLVLTVQRLFRNRLSSRWRCALWLLVVVRLVLPVSPESSWSVFNLASSAREAVLPIHSGPAAELLPEGSGEPAPYEISEVAPAEDQVAPPATEGAAGVQTAKPGFGVWQNILAGGWIAGVLALGLRLAVTNIRFAGRLRRNARPPENPAVFRLFDDCRREVGVRRRIPVRETSLVASPALFGLYRPTLLLPRGMSVRFSQSRLRHIFLHELAHVRRGDVALEWILIGLRTLHWFNPVLGFAFRRMRADRELACDASALSMANEENAANYGRTIIKVLEFDKQPQPMPGLVGILENRNDMKQRIRMIVTYGKGPRGSFVALLLMFCLAMVALTDARQMDRTRAPAPETESESAESNADNSLVSVRLSLVDIKITVVRDSGTPGTSSRSVVQDGSRRRITVDNRSVVDGNDIRAVRREKDDSGHPTLSLVLSEDSARRLAGEARRHSGEEVTVLVEIRPPGGGNTRFRFLRQVSREIENQRFELTGLAPEQIADVIEGLHWWSDAPPDGLAERRRIEASNLRQIVQASLIFAQQPPGKLPGDWPHYREEEAVKTVHDVARLLALEPVGLNHYSMWIPVKDYRESGRDYSSEFVIVRPDGTLNPSFAEEDVIAFDYATGLSLEMSSYTPVAWTRGLREDGTWSEDGVFGSDGGLIGFMNGGILVFEDLKADGGQLKRPDGTPTSNILEALPSGAQVVGSGPGTLHGARGTGAP